MNSPQNEASESIKNFGTKQDFIIKLELSNEKNSENVIEP